MNRYYYFVIMILFFIGISLNPSLALAEENEEQTPPPPVQNSVRVDVKTNAQLKQNLLRNEIRVQSEKHEEKPRILPKIASSTRAEIKDIRTEGRLEVKDIRKDGRILEKNASSTAERREIKNQVRIDIFKARQSTLVAQLNLAINNLKQVRARLSTRIDKAQADGKDMTQAKKLLEMADTKIALAASEVLKISSFNPTPNATSSSVTTEIDLSKPREIADAAIKAIKNAHRALIDVTVAIAHNMGARCEIEDGEKLHCIATTNIQATTTNQ